LVFFSLSQYYHGSKGNLRLLQWALIPAPVQWKAKKFAAAASGFWSIVTTVISTGSVNAMHDSNMPSGMNELSI
jgi:K+-transporting ATPase A subunit